METDLPDRLKKRIQTVAERLAQQEFFVLVWGSGTAHEEAHTKRLKIKAHLAQQLGEDSVFLSEDQRFKEFVEQYGLRVAEAIEVGAVDAVVVLDTSIGPHTELATFERILRGKSIVFAAESYRDSSNFAAVSYHALKVEWYSPEEYESCTEIRRKANDFCQTIRFLRANADALRLV